MTRSGVPDGGSGRCSGMSTSSGLGLVRVGPGSADVLVVVREGVVGPVAVSVPWVAHADVVDPVDQGASAQRDDVAPAAGPVDIAHDRCGFRDLGAELRGGQGAADALVEVLDRLQRDVRPVSLVAGRDLAGGDAAVGPV